MFRIHVTSIFLSFLFVTSAFAQDLEVDGTTISLGGIHQYDAVRVINGGRITVPLLYGGDKTNTGNLHLVASSILVDATSSIVANGSGYQAEICDNGPGPNNTAGGRGGCSVKDSGGGGAHFGGGGRGTKDCFVVAPTNSCQFPQEFEESCGYRDNLTCIHWPSTGCYDYDGLPSVAGVAFRHSIYEVEFGAAGGDKGCRDGDGWDCSVGGAGGGRIVLAAVNSTQTGVLDIRGTVSANGKRGCGKGNDSGGGGAGGTILLVGDQVTVASGANIAAAGGLGGDTQGHSDCPSCAQVGGTCDDCGGGGGGGLISILSRQKATLNSLAIFNVDGALGGTCGICQGEAGGGAGELQLNGTYKGEFCDGYDNDFDGQIDEGLGTVSCGTGSCQVTVQTCNTSIPQNVYPNDCVPLSDPTCQSPLTDTRSRFMVVVDTSGSMLSNLSGVPTFGDGSTNHAGLDFDGDGVANDSRLYKAKEALKKVISAYPEIDFGLARFAQDIGTNINCQLAHWFECENLCCTYDNPQNNTGGTPPAGACTVNGGTLGNISVQPQSSGDECINYAGSCGAPRRGADILVGFEKKIAQKIMWLDHKEINFNTSTTDGDHCNYTVSGDCELRGTGPTPLYDSLKAVEAYLTAAKAEDSISSCRRYSVILLTDGAETCMGEPKNAAADLLGNGIETYVVGFSVLASEQTALDEVAKAGSSSGTRTAFFVGNEDQLASALASIVDESVVFEECNGIDDDCDLQIDEDFLLKGTICNNGLLGECYAIGIYICKADGSGVECDALSPTGSTEICDGKDNDCDGAVDEDIPGGCIPCVPQPEVCNGISDDCDEEIDEGIVQVSCGIDVGECKPGLTKCIGGILVCDGSIGKTPETCDGKDNDCDGSRDGIVEVCYSFSTGCDVQTGICVGQCKLGKRLCSAVETNGVWSGEWGTCKGEAGPSIEVCDGVDNNCDGATDEQAECPGGSLCVEGICTKACDGEEFGCPAGQICKNGWCIPDTCDPVACGANGWICKAGKCVDPCENVTCGNLEECVNGVCIDVSCYAKGCPTGQRCVAGICEDDPCFEKNCNADEYCYDGKCLKVCDALNCPKGQTCRLVDSNGEKEVQCVRDPCADIVCDNGKYCKDGTCIDDSCGSINCPNGKTCIDGACVEDLCEYVECPSGYRCEQGVCTNAKAGTLILATGAGGCTCAIENSDIVKDFPWVFFGCFGVFLFGRWLNRKNSLLFVFALITITNISCNQDPFYIENIYDSASTVTDGGVKDINIIIVDGEIQDTGYDQKVFADLSYDMCISLPELCNNVDDNCKDGIDEGYDKFNDPRYCENCKGCSYLIALNAMPGCKSGQCVIDQCAGGYVDLNGDLIDGCEYVCTPTGPEICDGKDNDCDGKVDNGVVYSTNTCLQIGPCAGSFPECKGEKGWVCNYTADVELQPCTKDEDCGAGIKCENNVCPGMVIINEQLCNGKDGDCDGSIDDPWTNPTLSNVLGSICTPDPTKKGICQPLGEYVCDAAQTGVECYLTQIGSQATDEICNGLDDDCDGLIDEEEDDAAGKGVIDSMVHIQRTVSGTSYDFYIYAYEASRPDATSTNSGNKSTRSCSKSGVIPWANVTYNEAAAACLASGKRICTGSEWEVACQGASGKVYPYGNNYLATYCNGDDYGAGGVLKTGSLLICQGGDPGIFDMSGNLREWTNDQRGTTSPPESTPIYVVRGGAYHTPYYGMSCNFELSQSVGDVVLPANGFRCCSDSAP